MYDNRHRSPYLEESDKSMLNTLKKKGADNNLVD